jgi:hypothetical protein
LAITFDPKRDDDNAETMCARWRLPRRNRDVIENDLLVGLDALVFAEAFSDLLEQSEHLLGGGYFLAAGVLGRACLTAL